MTDNGKKVKNPWNDIQIEALVRGIEDYGIGHWSVIAKANECLRDRSGCDLKDKWRWIEKKRAEGKVFYQSSKGNGKERGVGSKSGTKRKTLEGKSSDPRRKKVSVPSPPDGFLSFSDAQAYGVDIAGEYEDDEEEYELCLDGDNPDRLHRYGATEWCPDPRSPASIEDDSEEGCEDSDVISTEVDGAPYKCGRGCGFGSTYCAVVEGHEMSCRFEVDNMDEDADMSQDEPLPSSEGVSPVTDVAEKSSDEPELNASGRVKRTKMGVPKVMYGEVCSPHDHSILLLALHDCCSLPLTLHSSTLPSPCLTRGFTPGNSR